MNILKAILSIFKKKEEAKVEEGCCGKQEVCCKFDEPAITVEEPKAEEVKVEETKVTAKEVKAKAKKPKAPKVEEVVSEEAVEKKKPRRRRKAKPKTDEDQK